jgi:hypothetical protein
MFERGGRPTASSLKSKYQEGSKYLGTGSEL